MGGTKPAGSGQRTLRLHSFSSEFSFQPSVRVREVLFTDYRYRYHLHAITTKYRVHLIVKLWVDSSHKIRNAVASYGRITYRSDDVMPCPTLRDLYQHDCFILQVEFRGSGIIHIQIEHDFQTGFPSAESYHRKIYRYDAEFPSSLIPKEKHSSPL